MTKFAHYLLLGSALLSACLTILFVALLIQAQPSPPTLEMTPRVIDKKCLTKIRDGISDQFFSSFLSKKTVNDINYCRSLVRWGDECWEKVIKAYADPCHILPYIITQFLRILPKSITPPFLS